MIALCKKYSLALPIAFLALLAIGAAYFASPASSGFLWSASAGGSWLLPLITAAALADSINPCAVGILIITIAFLLGIGQGRGGVLKLGGAYVAGVFVVYLLIGLGILGTLHLFGTPHFMAKAGALLLTAVGLWSILTWAFPKQMPTLKIPSFSHRFMAHFVGKASLPAAFLLGGLVGLCEFPCTGGPYLAALALLHDTTFALQFRGFAYLVLYNIIFVLPLLVILAVASNRRMVGKIEEWKKEKTETLRLWSGLLMAVVGALMFWLS
jgi:cytochrome c biogenesis protein CcdA